MKRYEMFWNDQEARERADGKWVRYDDARAVIDGLQALLNERDAEVDKATCLLREVSGYVRHPDYDWFPCDVEDVAAFLTKGPTPYQCEPFDFNLDAELPAPAAPSWAVPVRVSFDAAEGEGRVWLMVAPEDDESEPWVAIEGRENARKLAALLLAWAGDK